METDMAEGDPPSDAPEPADGIGAKAPPSRPWLMPPWKPGQSGNPKGTPQGSRHKISIAVAEMLRGEAAVITRAVLLKAKEGGDAAQRLVMDRIAPACKDATVSFRLPPMQTTADAIAAISAVADAVAAGEISPSEGAELGKLVDSFTNALGAHDLAGRIASLEASRDESSES